MARERIISAEAAGGGAGPEAEERVHTALRPQSLDAYVGQPKLVEKLRIALQAVTERDEPMEHVLLHGPPGLGKTTLAHIIANEMSTHLTVTAGPALTKPGDLVGLVSKLQKRDVLFVDEIHRLPISVEEYLYSAMEDFKIEVQIDQGMHAKTISLPLQPFTLIGATTRAGLVSGPMRSRFGLTHNLEFYSQAELLKILRRSAGLLGLDPLAAGADGGRAVTGPRPPAEPGANGDALREALTAIASRSRGTPRVANRLLRRVRDFAQVRRDGELSPQVVDEALKLEGVDPLGLDELDRKYLRVIGETYEGGPVGVEAVAATLGEDAGTLEEMVEPYLLQVGFLARTRRGRQLTRAGAAHLGLRLAAAAEAGDGLFDDDD